MPLKSRWTISIPDTSLPSYLFTSPTHPLPTTPKFIDANRPHTHVLSTADFRLWSKRFAAGMQMSGLEPGDRVLLFSGNNLFFPVAFMGIVMAGGVFTGANPGYTSRELASQLGDSGARWLICSKGSLETGIQAAEMVGLGKGNVFVFDDGVFDGPTNDGGSEREEWRGCRYWGELIASVEDGERFRWEEFKTRGDANRTLALNYSSGTTGKPKGVEITHRNYIANTCQMVYHSTGDPNCEARNKHLRWICFLPMYHAMAQTIFIANATMRQIPVYIMPKFDFLKMLEYIQKYRITELTLVPPIAVALAKHPIVRKFDLSSVEKVGSGAAPLSGEVCEEFESLWEKGKINVRQGYGMTECTCSLMGWHPDEIAKGSAVGELNPNCEAKIMDDDGKTELGRGQRGELWMRGPNVMKGYWRNPEATRETLTKDGWLKSGDIAVVDEDGKFHIVDRKKELIKVKGNQVAPAELEAVLLENHAVADAAVVGVTINGEEYPRAYIVLKGEEEHNKAKTKTETTAAAAQSIIKFMSEKVSKTKQITGGIVFVDNIPKTPSGKILRKVIRERAKREVDSSGGGGGGGESRIMIARASSSSSRL
ncbi:MAG: hypothetical protein M1834_005605 [Cirrosporium novae-zelandiae]|nr:MAG: hypothetical protein M1834_005605 [Cirrosporium novae-zelandiae]